MKEGTGGRKGARKKKMEREERHRKMGGRKNYHVGKWNDTESIREQWRMDGNIVTSDWIGLFPCRKLYPNLPEWMWSWAVLLIGMGLFIGIRHNFRSPAWFILMVVGGVVLIKSDEFAKYFPGVKRQSYLAFSILLSWACFLYSALTGVIAGKTM